MRVLLLTDNRRAAVEVIKWTAARHEIVGCVYDFDKATFLRDTCQMLGLMSIDSKAVYDRMNTIPRPDLIISYLFKHLIKKPLIEFAPVNDYGYHNIINFHPAPLPDVRGCGMCSQAVLNNFDEWGVSVHYVNEGFDTGALIRVSRFPIEKDSTSIEVQIAAQKEQLKLFKSIMESTDGRKGFPGQPQDPNVGIYYSDHDLQSMKVVHDDDSEETILRKVRGMFFPPYDGAYVELHGKRYTLIDDAILKKLGELYSEYEDRLYCQWLTDDPENSNRT